MIWEYFQIASIKAIAKEKTLWQSNQIEETLDYVLGTYRHTSVKKVAILQGYDDNAMENT